MSSLTLRFRGWKGVVFLLGLAVLLWLRYGRTWELPPRARETIMLRLLADQSSQVFTANAGVPRTKLDLQRIAGELGHAQSIQIDRAETHGILWPKYVRVAVSVQGAPPADGRDVRYFTLDVLGNATALPSGAKYYLSLW